MSSQAPIVDTPAAAGESPVTLQCRALLLGHRIELRRVRDFPIIGRDPLTVDLDDGAIAVLFRYGALVTFGLPPGREASIIAKLQGLVTSPLASPEVENLRLRIRHGTEEQVDDDGLELPDLRMERLQVVADVLAKSVMLADYEQRVVNAFDRVEPLAQGLPNFGRTPPREEGLLRHIGETLEIQHRLVGRGQIGEKPEILWEHPELERLYLRLEQEYEIGERRLVLEHKIQLINATAETLLNLLQARRSLRVEWYIVILIVVEILLTLYELFIRGH